MKTLAVRLDEETMDLLGVVSQLEGTTMVDQIRIAVEAHLEKKVAGGQLAARAQEAIQAIDAEAEARKAAIGALVSQAAPEGATGAPEAQLGGGRRRGGGAAK
ncbi:MAG TPA: hypothetical protein VHB02_03895 [Acidimicrobiales bacterium]|nr:hypothetical protein [Acidimicrobiales bacterium]